MEKFKENEITQYYYPGYMDDYDKIVQSSIPVLQMISVVKKYPVILAIVSAAIVVIESILVMARSVEKWSLFRKN